MKRWLIVGLLSGAAAVLVFHQGAAALLHAAGFTPRAPYSFAATQPWGVPLVWSLAFWGGVWGVVLAAAVRRLDRIAVVGASLLFGAILPTLIAWFVVAPLKGQPVAAGFVPAAMMIGPIVNAAWGLGTGLGLALFGHGAERLSGHGAERLSGRGEHRRGAADRRGPREPVVGERRRGIADRRLAAG